MNASSSAAHTETANGSAAAPAAYDKAADVAAVAKSVTSVINHGIVLTAALEERVKRCEGALTKNGQNEHYVALEERVKRCEGALTKDEQSEHYASLSKVLQAALDTFARPIKFGSHRDGAHCYGCQPLRESAQRALMVGGLLYGLLQFPLPSYEKAYDLVVGLLSLARQYANEYLRDEDDDVKKSLQSMIETSQKIDHWVEFARIVVDEARPLNRVIEK